MYGIREADWTRNALVRLGIRKPASWLRSRKRLGQERRETKSLAATSGMSIWFQHDRSLVLHRIFDLYGSDKGSAVGTSPHFPWTPHTYADVYSSLFAHCRFSIGTVFECGIGTNRTEFLSNMSERGRPGASLRAWRDYFPNAQIIGADIDASVLFQEDRIRTYFVDQTDPASVDDMWKMAGEPTLDLIVDDGLHSLHAAATLLEGSWHLLRDGGLYIIEDVQLHQLDLYRSRLEHSTAWVSYVILPRRVDTLVDDNCLIILRKPGG